VVLPTLAVSRLVIAKLLEVRIVDLEYILLVFAEQKYFELERQQVADHSRLETEAKAAAELRWQVSDLGEWAVNTVALRKF